MCQEVPLRLALQRQRSQAGYERRGRDTGLMLVDQGSHAGWGRLSWKAGHLAQTQFCTPGGTLPEPPAGLGFVLCCSLCAFSPLLMLPQSWPHSFGCKAQSFHHFLKFSDFQRCIHFSNSSENLGVVRRGRNKEASAFHRLPGSPSLPSVVQPERNFLPWLSNVLSTFRPP